MVRDRITLVVALVLVAPLAQASDGAAFIAAAAADSITTELALANNPAAREANPLLQGQAQRIALKAATTAAIVYLHQRLKPRHPRGAKVLKVVVVVGWSAIAVWNAHHIAPMKETVPLEGVR